MTIKYQKKERVMSTVDPTQHTLKRDEQGRENCTACSLYALSHLADVITLHAAERQENKKYLYRELIYASSYEINILQYIVCGIGEEENPKDAIYLTTLKVVVASSCEREDFIFRKAKLVMPLHLPMKNAHLKNAN